MSMTRTAGIKPYIAQELRSALPCPTLQHHFKDHIISPSPASCGNLLIGSLPVRKRQNTRNSPHTAIRPGSDLLQANVLVRNFPDRAVDLLTTELDPRLHWAMKENRQRANLHRAHSDSYAIFCMRSPKGHCVGTNLSHAKIKINKLSMLFRWAPNVRGIDTRNHEPLKLCNMLAAVRRVSICLMMSLSPAHAHFHIQTTAWLTGCWCSPSEHICVMWDTFDHLNLS